MVLVAYLVLEQPQGRILPALAPVVLYLGFDF